METYGVSTFFQRERNRWADQINREAWKFEQFERPRRRRMKIAMFRDRLGF